MPNDPRRRFVRAYYDDLEKDYPEVWFDPTCLSTFIRLLALADKAWPSHPELPVSARRADLRILRDLGLLVDLEHGRFGVKGYEEERADRAERARAAVSQRKDRSTSVPTDVPTPVGTDVVLAGARAGVGVGTGVGNSSFEEGVQGEPDPFDAYWSLTTRYPKGGAASWLDDLTSKYGSQPVIRHLAAAWLEEAKVGTLLGRASDRLAREARQLDRKEQEAERARLAEKRAIPKVVPEWDVQFREAIERHYANLERPA